MLKLGSELKELETVQEELEKKEQELRSERNMVMDHLKTSWIQTVSNSIILSFFFLPLRDLNCRQS